MGHVAGSCARSQDAAALALIHFGGADLGDQRLSRRLVKYAQRAFASPDASIPNACATWGEAKAAYRLLSHPEIKPMQLQQVHRRRTLRLCSERDVVLLVQDSTQLDFTRQAWTIEGLTPIGDGKGRGLHLHNVLALTPEGETLGLVEQRFFDRPEPGARRGTRTERLGRWRESLVWSDAVHQVGRPPAGSRWIHVCDSAGDSFDTIHACDQVGVGFLIRAGRDRSVEDGEARLWEHCEQWPVAGEITVSLRQRTDSRGRVVRKAGPAVLEVRFARVVLDPPTLRPERFAPREVTAVYIREREGTEDRVDWLLLTDECAHELADAIRVAGWYQNRWRIEEFHRCMKEGCKVQEVQFDDVEDIKRFTMIKSVVATFLLEMRDLARGERADDPAALQAMAEPAQIEVAASLAKLPPEAMTPRLFIRTIARRGGFLARRSDGEPGWKTIWRGWREFQPLVAGYILGRSSTPTTGCG